MHKSELSYLTRYHGNPSRGSISIRTTRRPKTKTMRTSRNEPESESVYVIKFKIKSGRTNHPLYPSMLAVNGYFRYKWAAREALDKLAQKAKEYELARACGKPSPATVNLIRQADENSDFIEVVTLEGDIKRFFIEELLCYG